MKRKTVSTMLVLCLILNTEGLVFATNNKNNKNVENNIIKNNAFYGEEQNEEETSFIPNEYKHLLSANEENNNEELNDTDLTSEKANSGDIDGEDNVESKNDEFDKVSSDMPSTLQGEDFEISEDVESNETNNNEEANYKNPTSVEENNNDSITHQL